MISRSRSGTFPAISKEYYSWEKQERPAKRPFYTRKIVWMPLALLVAGAFAAWVAFGILTSQYQSRAEEFDLSQVSQMEAASILYDRNGREFGKIFIQNRQPVPYERLPEKLVQAVIAAEDNRFYSHDGVDYMGIFRAAITNYRQGRIAQGASTVTQQLARNSFELRERTYERKLVEMYLAWRIEKNFSKKQIMEAYLNRVYFGSGFYGAEAAAQGYFGKNALDLTIGQCATLAGLLKSPNALSPFNNPTGSQESRDVVLQKMRDLGFITRKQLADEQAAPLGTVQRTNPFKAGYAQELIRQQVIKALGFERAMNGGYRIDTTLDSNLQRTAEKATRDFLSEVESRPGYTHPTFEEYRASTRQMEEAVNKGHSVKMPEPKYLQGAALAVDNSTGGILALVGGRDFRHSEYNRAIQGKRPAGTAFLPFVYTAAFEAGSFPGELVQDACIDNRYVMVGGETGILGEWGVETAENDYEGPITARDALLKGKNAATVRLGMKTGLDKIIETSAAAGISSPLRDYSNTFLGSSELSLDELVLANTVFPNLGERPANLYIIQAIQDPAGETIFNAPRKRLRALAPGPTYQVHSILSEYMQQGQGKEAAARAGLPEFPVAGRPGTAYGFTDTYFVGYTQAVTCGVWVGFDKPTRIFRGAFGKDLALPIWAKIMAAAVKKYPPRPITQPPGLQTVEICRSSGLLATPRCQPKTQTASMDPASTRSGSVYKELATSDQLPKIPCDIHGGGIRTYAREFNEEDWPRAASAIDLTKIRPVAVTSPALTGYNDVYRSVRPGEEADNDDSIPVAKAIAVNSTPPATEAPLPVEAPPGGIEIRRAEAVDSQAPPMEAPAIEAPAPDPIQFFQ